AAMFAASPRTSTNSETRPRTPCPRARRRSKRFLTSRMTPACGPAPTTKASVHPIGTLRDGPRTEDVVPGADRRPHAARRSFVASTTRAFRRAHRVGRLRHGAGIPTRALLGSRAALPDAVLFAVRLECMHTRGRALRHDTAGPSADPVRCV